MDLSFELQDGLAEFERQVSFTLVRVTRFHLNGQAWRYRQCSTHVDDYCSLAFAVIQTPESSS
jgi:hypothetical protein